MLNKTPFDEFKAWCKTNGVDFKSTSVEQHALKRCYQVWCILHAQSVRRKVKFGKELDKIEMEIQAIYE